MSRYRAPETFSPADWNEWEARVNLVKQERDSLRRALDELLGRLCPACKAKETSRG